jgi:hypothetical protein
MYLRLTVALLAALAVCAEIRAQAVVIDFDDLNNGDIVTNQYPEATFSAETGYENQITAQSLGSSLPNFICTAPIGGGIDCVHETYVDFTQAVNGLSFLAVGVNDSGIVAKVDVFENNAYSATVDVIGDATPFTPDPVDLSAYSAVTRIEIHTITDTAGIGWDDFRFTIPEPSSALLMLGSCGLAFAARRRR